VPHHRCKPRANRQKEHTNENESRSSGVRRDGRSVAAVALFRVEPRGIAAGWIYLALPITAASALGAAWLVHFGANWGAKVDGLGQNSGVPARPLASPSPAASFSQRLQELANLRASGAISDREYIERHRRIISVARTVVLRRGKRTDVQWSRMNSINSRLGLAE
jgi:hypothetical protein